MAPLCLFNFIRYIQIIRMVTELLLWQINASTAVWSRMVEQQHAYKREPMMFTCPVCNTLSTGLYIAVFNNPPLQNPKWMVRQLYALVYNEVRALPFTPPAVCCFIHLQCVINFPHISRCWALASLCIHISY